MLVWPSVLLGLRAAQARGPLVAD